MNEQQINELISQGIELSQRLEYFTSCRIYGDLDEEEKNTLEELQKIKETICKHIDEIMLRKNMINIQGNILVKDGNYYTNRLYKFVKEKIVIQRCSIEFFVEHLLNHEVDENLFLKPLFEIKTITIGEEVLLLEKFGYEETENFKNIIRHINKMIEANEDYDEDGDSISSIRNNLIRSPLYDFIQTNRRLNQIKRLGVYYCY